jgi:hypothetical protein
MAAIKQLSPFETCAQLIVKESGASSILNEKTYTLEEAISRMNGLTALIEKVKNLHLAQTEELQKRLDEAIHIFKQPLVKQPEELQRCYAEVTALWKKIVAKAPLEQEEKEGEDPYILYDITKRSPPFSVVDTRQKIIRKSSFIPPNMKEVLKVVHPLFFAQIGDLPKEAHGIARNGKHVLLQQAQNSSIPTACAMLALDHNKVADLQATIMTFRATEKDAIKWIEKAKLKPILTHVPDLIPAQFLAGKLQEQGSGILFLDHPSLFGHVVVLDAISLQKKEAIIRDPFHGAMLTVQLDILIEWVQSSYFLQVKE